MDKYHVLEFIGEGSFAKVHRGRKKYTGQIVALKFISKLNKTEKELKNLKHEIEILRSLKHENIIELLDSYETDKEVVVVTEYAEGELFGLLEDDQSLPEEQVQVIACQLVSALHYLHSHRILHRDMKPQNILLCKGNIVKLCDFGFARAMSCETMVVTSIKGTPLYMSPELVKDRPYDHNADLWALGCILYEIYTGSPPFQTNSLMVLVDLITKCQIQWPDEISPAFKNFLQGLLTKEPSKRLTWPELADHEFVKDGVKIPDLTASIMEPLTVPLTEEQMKRKLAQQKEKAPPPGTSRILNRATREHKKNQKNNPATTDAAPSSQATTNNTKNSKPVQSSNKQEPSKINESQTTKPAANNKTDTAQNEIEEWQNLAEELNPEVNFELCEKMLQDVAFLSRFKLSLFNSKTQMLDAKIEGASLFRELCKILCNLLSMQFGEDEEEDDEEEEGNREDGSATRKSQAEIKKSKILTARSKKRTQDFDARQALILQQLQNFEKFCNFLELPQFFTELIKLFINDKSNLKNLKEQIWFNQIELDVLVLLHSFFSSQLSFLDQISPATRNNYLTHAKEFLLLAQHLLNQQNDTDLRIKERTMICLISLCEIFEQTPEYGDEWFSMICGSSGKNDCKLIDAYFKSMMPDESQLLKLIELTKGDRNEAEERQEDLLHLGVAILAAFTYVPLNVSTRAQAQKHRVSKFISEKLLDAANLVFIENWLLFLRHPTSCINVLKALYCLCLANPNMGLYLSKNPHHLESLYDILAEKVELPPIIINEAVEIGVHTLSTIIIQLFEISFNGASSLTQVSMMNGKQIVDAANNLNSADLFWDERFANIMSASPQLFNIFLQSQVASHTAAGALLFNQLLLIGCPCEVQPETMIASAISVLTDLNQIHVKCPFNYGILDGLLMLLNQMLNQGEQMIADQFLETELWDLLWSRVIQSLKPSQQQQQQEEQMLLTLTDPDWAFLSPNGFVSILQLTARMLTMSTQNCIAVLFKDDNIMFDCLACMLSDGFLNSLKKTHETRASLMLNEAEAALSTRRRNANEEIDGVMNMMDNEDSVEYLINEFILSICQILCFPFAIDANEDLTGRIYKIIKEFNFFNKIIAACMLNTTSTHDVPISLIARLVLTDEDLVQLMIDQLNNSNQFCDFFAKLLHQVTSNESLQADILAIFSHLSRKSEDVVASIIKILKGPPGAAQSSDRSFNSNFSIVIKFLNGNSMLKSRCCNMLGNLMKHNDLFYDTLKKHKPIFDNLVRCCQTDELNVRKSAIFAIGNCIFHNDSLYSYVDEILPTVVNLLNDSLAKTRIHSTAAIGNLVNHKFSEKMVTLKVLQKLLEVACHDTQFSVQESALNALRIFCKYEKAKKILRDVDAVEKLSNINFISASDTNLNASIKNNYMTAVTTCRNIIKLIKSA